MERFIDIELLQMARGDANSLPTPQELAKLLADAEIALLAASPRVDSKLEETGWYLHAVASAPDALDRYGVERQRVAYQVAAHVFDLLLQSQEHSPIRQLRYCFATQIAYITSGFDPNAIAVYRRELAGEEPSSLSFVDDVDKLALSLGSALLAMRTKVLFHELPQLRRAISRIPREWAVADVTQTMFGAAARVVDGVWALLQFLVHGDPDRVEDARGHFRVALQCRAATGDRDSRWVAGHLLYACDGMERSSVWAVLPPDVPDGVKRAFALGSPQVLTLWPPQLKMLGSDTGESGNAVFSCTTKRALLSMPTSSGKTLIAQVLIAAHIVSRGTSVCYVAPTRSLCNEVRRSLRRRLRYLDYPVCGDMSESLAVVGPGADAGVAVMTPERLSSLVRADLPGLLDRFGLFVIDEAHHVGDDGRGWVLEAALTHLHNATLDTHHRIILMSAAIGNRNHFLQWLSTADASPLEEHSEWRGPRRLHCVYTANPDRHEVTQLPRPRSNSPRREAYRLFGQLHIRVAHDQRPQTMRTTESVGKLVVRLPERRRDDQSTPFYKTLVPLVLHLMAAGPVLVVQADKRTAKNMAKAIAQATGEGPVQELQHVAETAREWLGQEHPLARALENGVAYHYGPLPTDVRLSVEEAFAGGALPCLVATTTLAEGVNLPVRSVVIGSTETHGPGGPERIITGPKLLNVIGRAGRAALETEGIVVLACHDSRHLAAALNEIEQGAVAQSISSSLTTPEALRQLAELEDLLRESVDAAFEADRESAEDFVDFVWSVGADLERLGAAAQSEDVLAVVQRTLAWQQLPQEERQRWARLVEAVTEAYQDTPPEERRRWAEASTSLNTSRALESYVAGLLERAAEVAESADPVALLAVLLQDGLLLRLASKKGLTGPAFFNHAGRGRQSLQVDVVGIIQDWLKGEPLTSIAETHLSEVRDTEYRFEQLGDFISQYLEYGLPVLLRTVVSWFNTIADQRGIDARLPDELPSSIRYGTDNSDALGLMLQGLPSRTFARRVAETWASADSALGIVMWLASLTIAEWRESLQAGPRQIRQLLELVRAPRGGVAARVVQGQEAVVGVEPLVERLRSTDVRLADADSADPPVLGVWHQDQLVAAVRPMVQAELMDLLDTGLPLLLELTIERSDASLAISLTPPQDL